ncbi:hypothetical protein AQUCO_00200572v1 [Aquilegia coerulea]|uniref:Gnk2-homologous domain-containing protein n=1 Tax=Aquilegia coerulea TaxID=218851 RepID=A0A2G5F3Q0_AQUCA|nr:hypothetical protein AQUCO_00200572v1 [Aquilegia coerulea]
MTMNLFFHLLFFLLVLLLHCSTKSSLPLLQALNCTLPSPQSNKINILTNSTLDKLWAKASQTGYASFNLNHFKVNMQCRINLPANVCAQCLHDARHAILTRCPKSDSVTAWFDDLALFNSALKTLLLQLRTSINLASHRKYSHAEISYSNTSSKLYGLAECDQSVSAKECEVCVGEAVNKLFICCGAKQGGIVAAASCMVQFASYRLYSLPTPAVGRSDSGRTSDIINTDYSKTRICAGLTMKVVWAWCVGVACFIALVIGTWLLRRNIVNTAQVTTASEASFEVGNNGDI